ncbi:MAG: CHAT domain-containing protein, partial [Holophagales bacterium]|nr:CHAT domain-containing protein [Holophagales bacterium]
RSAERRLTGRARRHLSLLGRGGDPAAARSAEGEVHAALAELEAVRAELRRHHPRIAAAAEPPPLDADGLRRLLDPETTLVQILLGEARSFLWWVTASTIEVHELPPRVQLEALAEEAHRGLRRVAGAGVERRRSLRSLGRLLLGPFADRLADLPADPRDGVRRLAVVADGALHLVPFAALEVPGAGEPLVARREVVRLSSASALATLRRGGNAGASGGETVAVLADPIFGPDDPRLDPGARDRTAEEGSESSARSAIRDSGGRVSGAAGAALEALPRLPQTRGEAEAIARLLPPERRFLALGAEASRALVVDGSLRPFSILHFASHGFVDPRVPELSGLVLSRFDAEGREIDGFLGLHDVAHLELEAGLVVLSGCRTALGKAVGGEGWIGLGRGFHYAGVPRVVSSLWQVRDQAAAHLMAHFYRALLEEGRAPAAALRTAQLALREERRFRDPYYWAAFVLEGDWR